MPTPTEQPFSIYWRSAFFLSKLLVLLFFNQRALIIPWCIHYRVFFVHGYEWCPCMMTASMFWPSVQINKRMNEAHKQTKKNPGKKYHLWIWNACILLKRIRNGRVRAIKRGQSASSIHSCNKRVLSMINEILYISNFDLETRLNGTPLHFFSSQLNLFELRV